MSKSRAVVPYGNDLVLYIEMKRWDEQQKSYIDFDMTNVTDLVVFLTCSKHSTDIQLEYTVDEDHNNILVCPVDYRLLHTNASYGCYVEGYDENEKHFRFEMLPSELMLIISNTSGMQPDPNIGVIDIQGRVGWGLNDNTTIVLTYGQPISQETYDIIINKHPLVQVKSGNEYINLQTQVENGLLYFVSLYQIISGQEYYVTRLTYNHRLKMWNTYLGTLPSNTTLNNRLSEKQDTLVSGTNIKTINNQSILGEGNITIEGGGGTQVQADWSETDTEDPSYIQNKPDLSIYAESANLATVATSGDYDDLNNKPDLSNYATQSDLASKQDTLVSGTNIKTINNESILGEGNITIDNDEANEATANALFELNQKTNYNEQAIEALDASVKSQINQVVKDVNDIINNDVNTQLDEIDDELKAAALEINQLNTDKQDTLVSGTNIKTINNQSILGEGNITIEGGGGGTQVQSDWIETDTSDPSYIKHKPDLSIYAQSANLATVATSGSYNDLTNTPDLSIYAESSDLATVATSGDYDDLTNKPTLFSGDYDDLTNKPDLSIYAQSANLATVATSGDYDDLTNKPTLFSGDYDDLTNKPDLSIYAQSANLATVATSGSYNDLSNKPDLSNYATQSDLASKQDTLVSDTNIKTINNESILGSGNITVDNDEANEATANALFELNEKTNYNEQAIEALDASVKSQINQVVNDVNDIINNDVNAQLDEIDDELKAAALSMNTMVTSTQSGIVIEVVSALPANPTQNHIYIII